MRFLKVQDIRININLIESYTTSKGCLTIVGIGDESIYKFNYDSTPKEKLLEVMDYAMCMANDLSSIINYDNLLTNWKENGDN